MANATTMTYGDYAFSPVPLVTISRQDHQVLNRTDPLGYTFSMTLNGLLTPLPDGVTGLIQTDSLMEALRTGFNRSGKLLEIKCDSTVVMQIYPKVVSVNFAESNNNWVQTVPFSIEIEYNTDELNEHPVAGTEAPPFIEDYTEEWSMEFVEDQKHFTWDLSSLTNQDPSSDYSSGDQNNPFEARVTHTVTAKGKQSWVGPGLTGTPTSAADNAMAWLTGVYLNFGYNEQAWGHSLSGWTNLAGAGNFGEFDHMRAHTVNETDGSVSLTESWFIIGNQTGLGAAARNMTEDFTVNIRQGIDDGKVNVSVEGQIKGLEVRDYTELNSATGPVTTAAYDNANTAWSTLQDRIYPRAQFIFQQDHSTFLNPNATNKTIGHQPSKGVITYSYEFNDRPCAFITGALSENFTISDNHPTDVFAKLAVLGRPQGPVLQAISTVTERTREVSIEAVMPSPTGCSVITDLDLNKPTENVENLLCSFETQLTDVYNQVFKHADNESWNPITGRYTRSVGWTYSDCSGTISTSFC